MCDIGQIGQAVIFQPTEETTESEIPEETTVSPVLEEELVGQS